MTDITYTKAELEELAQDQESTAVCALLDDSTHEDADTLRQRSIQAAVALRWAAEKLGK